jgi:putative protein-disulfide isomerase
VWDALQAALPSEVQVNYVAGGLAPDTNLPMPQELQQTIQAHWHKIQSKLGTEFNFNFWSSNQPRRSTYLACRAVIAAKNQGCELEMIDAIQRAYYLRAMNPSDTEILLRLAWELYSQELNMDIDLFASDLESTSTHQELQHQIHLAAELSSEGFPSLVLEKDGVRTAIRRDYQDSGTALKEILALLAG